jgi:hypothetical protein
MQFTFSCPRRWEALHPTADTSIRFCDACQRQVYYCSTLKQARSHAAAGDCVAIDSMLNRQPGELTSAPTRLGQSRRVRVGKVRVAPSPRERPQEEEPEESAGLHGRPRDGRRGNNRRRHAQ